MVPRWSFDELELFSVLRPDNFFAHGVEEGHVLLQSEVTPLGCCGDTVPARPQKLGAVFALDRMNAHVHLCEHAGHPLFAGGSLQDYGLAD